MAAGGKRTHVRHIRHPRLNLVVPSDVDVQCSSFDTDSKLQQSTPNSALFASLPLCGRIAPLNHSSSHCHPTSQWPTMLLTYCEELFFIKQLNVATCPSLNER